MVQQSFLYQTKMVSILHQSLFFDFFGYGLVGWHALDSGYALFCSVEIVHYCLWGNKVLKTQVNSAQAATKYIAKYNLSINKGFAMVQAAHLTLAISGLACCLVINALWWPRRPTTF